MDAEDDFDLVAPDEDSNGPASTAPLTGTGAAMQDQVYDLATRSMYAAIVWDEAHLWTSSSGTNTAKFLVRKLRAHWRIGATATSFAYKPEQFYRLMRYFAPGLLGNSMKSWVRENFYRDQNMIIHANPRTWPETFEVVKHRVFTYSLDQVVDLPPLYFHHHTYPLSPIQRQAYDQLALNWTLDLKKGGETVKVQNALARITRLKQVCIHLGLVEKALRAAQGTGHDGDWMRGAWFGSMDQDSPKIAAALKMFLNDLSSEEKGVVYTGFKEAAFMVEDLFNKEGLKADSITGDVSSACRMTPQGVYSPRLAKCWQFNWGDVLLMCITSAAAEGINLPRGSHIWVLDLPWRPDQLFQAIGRIRRPVPKGMPGPFPVHVHIMLAEATIETRMLMPRLAGAARAAGFFVQGRDIMDGPEAALFSGDDGGSWMRRDDLIGAL